MQEAKEDTVLIVPPIGARFEDRMLLNELRRRLKIAFPNIVFRVEVAGHKRYEDDFFVDAPPEFRTMAMMTKLADVFAVFVAGSFWRRLFTKRKKVSIIAKWEA